MCPALSLQLRSSAAASRRINRGVAAQPMRGIVESFCGELRNRHGFEEAVHRAHGRLPIANFFENRENFSPPSLE
jgi:hypothetical protein